MTELLLDAPLRFAPVYQSIVWGGRRMAAFRNDLPAGPVGESWDLADHTRGMSVVADGPLTGLTLGQLMRQAGPRLVGGNYQGDTFPIMVKLIDATDRLSVQVHPDDALSQRFGLGERGKTECWYLLSEGELFAGTLPGTTRDQFIDAVHSGKTPQVLARHQVAPGDFVYLPARTIHALGAGCLIYEIQQTCDTTFRVYDWGRVGLDGKPRALHVKESLDTIDVDRHVKPDPVPHPFPADRRQLCSSPFFQAYEQRGTHLTGGGFDRCSIIIALDTPIRLSTAAGAIQLAPASTALVPASAGPWQADSLTAAPCRLLVAQPG